MNYRIILYTIILFSLPVAVSPASRAEAVVADKSAVAAGMDADVLDRIPARMQEFIKAGQISGAVTLVARKGKIVHLAATGEADIDAHRPMTTDALFAVASMTKPITGTA